MKKVIISLVMILTLCFSTLTVSAATNGCDDNTHASLVLYSKNLAYRVKTGEHIITDAEGRDSACYIYTEYYAVRYYCTACGLFVDTTTTSTNVHGHTGCPSYTG